MKNKKLFSFRFLLVAALLSTAFIAIKAAEDENGGGGGTGCIINPDIEKVGYCMLSTEFQWRCIPTTGDKNCTSSN